MQFKKNLFGNTYGRIEKDSNFYISPSGYKDSEIELIASINAFKKPSEFIRQRKGHPQCLFPARFRLLKEKLHLKVERVFCPGLTEWKKNIAANKINLVFASQFVSNPASIMGHTFIKFVDPKKANYLNLTTGYAANVPVDVGAVDYIRYGLFGGFNGEFNEAPYFRKVYEYNNIEDRDIWEIELKMNALEREYFLEILWELKHNAKIKYYFIDENCSFIILATLQTVFPEKDLLSGFPLYVLPHETIKKLSNEGLILSTYYRPSIRKILMQNYHKLSKVDKQFVLNSIDLMKLPSRTYSPKDADALDTLLSYIALQKEKSDGKLDSEQLNFKNNILLNRSKLTYSKHPRVIKSTMPLDSHGSFFVGYGYGDNSKYTKFHQLTFRPGFHKLMDYPSGFLSNSELNFMEFNLHYLPDKQKISFEKLNLIEVASTTPFYFIDPVWSWRFKANIYKLNDMSCLKCQVASVAPALGIGFIPLQRFYVQTLIGMEYLSSKELPKRSRFWIGPIIEGILDFFNYKIILREQLKKDLIDNTGSWMSRSEFGIRWHNILPHLHFDFEYAYNKFVKDIPSNSEIKGTLLMDF